MSKTTRIAIVGGGISGLATAYFLKKERARRNLDLELTLVERSPRLGGVIDTERRDGYVLEWGPENFVAFKPQLAQLIKELGMWDQVIGSNDRQRRTCVLHKGKLHSLPEGMAFLAPVNFRSFWSNRLISVPGKLRAMCEPLVPKSREDLDIYSFLKRRLGAELTDKVAEPLVSAIYGGDPRKLSIQSALPDTVRMERQFGSLWRGSRAMARKRPARGGGPLFLSMRDGMSTLVDGLEKEISEGVAIVKGAGPTRLRVNGRYLLQGERFEQAFDVVVLTAPAPAAAQFLTPALGDAGETLRSIRYSSTALVYLAYKKSEFSHPLDGFGFVAPRGEASVLDACTWVSTKFDSRCPQDQVLLRAAVHDGRMRRRETSDEQLAESVHDRLRQIMGFRCQPLFFKTVHKRRAMPQMDLDHERKLERVRLQLRRSPGLFACGAFWGGVGLPDCVATASAAAKQVVDHLGARSGAAAPPVEE